MASLKDLSSEKTVFDYLPPNAENYDKLNNLLFNGEVPREILELIVKAKWGHLFFLYLRYPQVDTKFICRMLEIGAPIYDQWSKMRIYYILRANRDTRFNSNLEALKPYIDVDIQYIYNNLFDYPSNENKFDLEYVKEKKQLIDRMYAKMYTYNGNGNVYKSTFQEFEKIFATIEDIFSGYDNSKRVAKEYLEFNLVQFLNTGHFFRYLNLNSFVNNTYESIRIQGDIITFVFRLGNIVYLTEILKKYKNKFNFNSYFIVVRFHLNLPFIIHYYNLLLNDGNYKMVRDNVYNNSDLLSIYHKINYPPELVERYEKIIEYYKNKCKNEN